MQYFDQNHAKHILVYTSLTNICKIVRKPYIFGAGFGSLKITFSKMMIALNHMEIGGSIIFYQDRVRSVNFDPDARNGDRVVING